MSRRFSYAGGNLQQGRLPPLLGALAATALVLILLPLTQTIGKREAPKLELRMVDTVLLPPPPPVVHPQPARQEDSQMKLNVPGMEAEMPDVALEPLEVNLQPGIGQVMAGVFQIGEFSGKLSGGGADGISMKPDVMDDLDIFEIGELDRRPRVISAPELIKPYELARDGISGRVRLKVLIEPSGRVRVLDVISADHPRLIRHARQFAEQCLYESPTRNGVPVAVAFILPISY